jgi:hypothetical protein
VGTAVPAQQCQEDSGSPPRFFETPPLTPNKTTHGNLAHFNNQDQNNVRTGTLANILVKDFERFSKSVEVATFKTKTALPLYDTGPTFVFVRDGVHLPLAKEFPFEMADEELESVHWFLPASFVDAKPIATKFETDASWVSTEPAAKLQERLKSMGQIEPTTLEHELPNTMMTSRKKNVISGQTYAGLKTMPPGSYSKIRVAHAGK